MVLEKTDYKELTKEAIKETKYSPFVILGVPLILALLGILLEPLFMLIIFIGPIAALIFYAHYTGNKISSAILGLLLFPLIFFYVEPIDRILDFQFMQLGRYFELTHIYAIIYEFWKYSLAYATIGFLVASRKMIYLAIALLVFILQFIEFISHID